MGTTFNKLARYILFLVVITATIYFLYLVREVLFSFVAAAILAYLLFRPVLFIESKGIKRPIAIIILYFLLFGTAAALLAFAVPGIVSELSQLTELIPEYAEEAKDMTAKVDDLNIPGEVKQIFDENIKKVNSYVYHGLRAFITSLYSLLGKVAAIIFSPILAFYILNDWEKIRDGLLQLLSPKARREISIVFNQIDNVLLEFLKGHLLVALFVGIAVGIAALIIGVKLPLLLGIIAAVTNLIPYFGAFLGGLPAVLLALSQSMADAAYMLIAVAVIQQIEGNVITPKIIGNKLGMHPLLIVFSILAGGKIMGFWGLLLAVPGAAVIKVIISWCYLKIVE
ncbi:MAG: AI-2E family transporter [Syntrophomonadaceae bacterium]|nr:AI-2E family transporter [Syntrophomonadaceae bacterium]